MDNIFINENRDGIPIDDIIWQDVVGNPFGKAANFNAIIFGDANNIVDIKGAFAVGGSFYSPRGLSLNFGDDLSSSDYTPENIGFLVGNNVSMNGSLVVVGHVVVNGGFRAARGSTFLIGKDGSPDQLEDLAYLYESSNQSQYWMPSDRGNHYIISSYDTPHYLPASRINADVPAFFQDARESMENYKDCIEDLPVNGLVEEDFHEWVLMGDDPDLNVFVLNRRPNGLINKGIRFDVPETSTIVVRLQTGVNAHLQYGLLGDESQADRTLYVFEDATNIYMEVPAAIWGSFLAPQAMLHGHQTGGHITGNVALNSFAVSATSGFEFHLPGFEGQILCEGLSDISFERPPSEVPGPPVPEPLTPEPTPVEPIIEEPEPPVPVEPIPLEPEPPLQEGPIQTRPIMPIIEEPIRQPKPEPMMPTPGPARPPDQVRPAPVLPERERQLGCPESPFIPIKKSIPKVNYPQARPCPTCPSPKPCPDCLVKEGLISGCIWGCKCCKNHYWAIELYEICDSQDVLVDCVEIGHYGCFEFIVPYDGCYTLTVKPIGPRQNQASFYRKTYPCKPIMSLNNIGVSNFYL